MKQRTRVRIMFGAYIFIYTRILPEVKISKRIDTLNYAEGVEKGFLAAADLAINTSSEKFGKLVAERWHENPASTMLLALMAIYIIGMQIWAKYGPEEVINSVEDNDD